MTFFAPGEGIGDKEGYGDGHGGAESGSGVHRAYGERRQLPSVSLIETGLESLSSGVGVQYFRLGYLLGVAPCINVATPSGMTTQGSFD